MLAAVTQTGLYSTAPLDGAGALPVLLPHSQINTKFDSKKIQKRPKMQHKLNFYRHFCGVSLFFDIKFIKEKLKIFQRQLSDR